MHTRRLLIVICHPRVARAALALCMFFLSSCVATTPTPEPVTISFAYYSSNDDHYQEMVSVFNESHPYITIDLKPQRDDRQFRQIGDAEEIVDTFELYPALLAPFYEQGRLLDLGAFVEQDDAFDLPDLYPSLVDLVTLDGTLSAIPLAVEPGAILYNKDLFDRYSVPYPQEGWTWQDFLNTAAALRDPEEKVFGFAPQILDPMYFEGAPHFIDPLYFVYQHGGRIFDDWDTPTRTTFDDPLTVEAVAWYAKLIHQHGIAPTRAEARQAFSGDARAVYGYMMEKVAMMYGGVSARFPRPGRDKAVNQGVVAPPRGAQSATTCVSTALAISSRTEQTKASWQWISFLSQQMPPELMPARRSLAESSAYEQAAGTEVAAAARAAMKSDVVLAFYIEERRFEAIEDFYQAVLDVCDGEATADEALSQAQQGSRFQ